jgi:hypothetical protein
MIEVKSRERFDEPFPRSPAGGKRYKVENVTR